MCSSTRGPAIAPSLVTWPDQEEREALGLGQPQQVRRTIAHLGDAARARLDRLGVDALHRVDDDHARLKLLDVARDGFEVRLGQHLDVAGDDAEPLGAQLDLRGRLFAGDVEHRTLAGTAHDRVAASASHSWISSVRLADARVAADQHDRARHDPAAQHAAQLPDRHGDALVAVGRDVGQRQRAGAAPAMAAPRARPAGASWIDRFDQRVPLAAVGALAHPLGLRAAAVRAHISGFRLHHQPVLLGAADRSFVRHCNVAAWRAVKPVASGN